MPHMWCFFSETAEVMKGVKTEGRGVKKEGGKR